MAIVGIYVVKFLGDIYNVYTVYIYITQQIHDEYTLNIPFPTSCDKATAAWSNQYSIVMHIKYWTVEIN